MTLNKAECSFDWKSLRFYGFVFSATGISPDPAKVKAIHEAPSPQSTSAVRSFLGMVNYCAKVIPRFSDLTMPLPVLTKKNTAFKWIYLHEKAFSEIKKALTSDIVMSYFDKKSNTEVITDTSQYGLSVILFQIHPHTGHRKVISYISRSLTEVEQRYSQTEREALAIVCSIERFNIYFFWWEIYAVYRLQTDGINLE